MCRKAAHSKTFSRSGMEEAVPRSRPSPHWTEREVDEAAFKDARLGRKKYRGTKALKRKVNPTRVPIEQKESVRWLDNFRRSIELLGQPARFVHVGDRESDIFELYRLTRDLGSHFLVRACVDQLADDGGHTIADEMDATRLKGLHRIEVRTDNGEITKVALEIRFKRILVQPPIGKQKRYPALDLTVIHAMERGAPKGRKPIVSKLITDLPVRGRAEAIEKINWYAMRWNRDVSQGPEVRLPGRSVQIAHGGTAREFDGSLLYS